MEKLVHTFRINLDWKLIASLSKIDRFDASWASIEKREGQSLKQLKSIATVRSVGASTRIEGSKLSDKEVEALLKKIEVTKMSDRDSQEVAGYFEVLNLISESHSDVAITEADIKNLHNLLLKHSEKDGWHKGNYKQHSNAVEATLPDGTKQVIFQTTKPGLPTHEAMSALMKWYEEDVDTHELVKSALFTYEFLSIHPFQDGNGRLSRVISTLLLLKQGYTWIQYVSFEHEIESRKTEYYRALRNCQSERPNENIDEWLSFFLDSIKRIQQQLTDKLKTQGVEAQLSPRESSIITFIGNHPGCKSGEIADKLGIANSTVKRLLAGMVSQKLIEKHGAGRGVNYTLS